MLRLELTIRKSQVAKGERGAKQFVRSIRANAQSPVFAFLVNTSSAVIAFICMLVTAAYIKHRSEYCLPPVDSAATNRTPWSEYVALAGLIGILAAMALTPGPSQGICL